MQTYFKSKNGCITLQIIGYDEPNNGRELHLAEIYINSQNFTKTYFKEGWNRLNFNLDEYIFESEDGNFVFIPAETHSFIINTHTFNRYFLPKKHVSTVTFQKNSFFHHTLMVYYSDEILTINLLDINF